MRVCAFILLGMLACCARLACAADAVSAEDVKAAFLLRFPAYMDWPAGALETPQFTIAVLGDDRLADFLEKASEGHRIKDKPVHVQRLAVADTVGDPQVLYLGPMSQSQLRRVLAMVDGRATLVVTAAERGLDTGSAVNFLTEDRRVRFEISQPAAERSGLRISSELLSVAVRVRRRTESP